MIEQFFSSDDKKFYLLIGDSNKLLPQINRKFDMIFADPPYFLSNGGISVQSGKMVSVNKGDWDKSQGFEKDNEFNYNWLKACRDKLKEDGTIWISGTYHNIFSVAHQLTKLGKRPTQSLSDLMRDVKGDSSLWINENKFVEGKFSWQEGYGAFSVSQSKVETVTRYILGQKEHHKKMTFQDELKMFLKEYQVEYNEEFI